MAAPLSLDFGARSLRGGPLFDHELLRGVDDSALARLVEASVCYTLTPGDVLMRKGEPNRLLYFIQSGRFSVHLDGLESPAVAYLGPGQTVGEMSILLGASSGASVRAVEPSRVTAADEGAVWALVSASHAFATNLLLMLARRMNHSNAAIVENARERERYERAATVDALTGIFNRRWLDDKLPRFIARHTFEHTPLSVLAIDADHFKVYNDTYGHAAGDEVLRSLASTLDASFRPGDGVARYGGEEFVVVLPSTGRAGARSAAERLRSRIRETPIWACGSGLPPLRVSIGIAELQAGDTAGGLLGRADAALYLAKSNGRDRVEG